jgi:uncharacterized damage-inducible protein DinB
MRTIAKPQPGEYAPYTIDYIKLVPDDGMVLTHLEANVRAVRQSVAAIPDKWLRMPFAAGEWTVQEILVHMMDTERVFAYRALRIGRGDVTDLPGFDQNAYVPLSGANERTLESLFAEYESIRAATLTLFTCLDDAAYLRVGTANKNPLSVRAALYIIAGHELHHLESIREHYVGRA